MVLLCVSAMSQWAAAITLLHFPLVKTEASCCVTRNAGPYMLSISSHRIVSGLVLSDGWLKRCWWWKCEHEAMWVCQWGGGSCVPHCQSCSPQSTRKKAGGCRRKAATVTKDSSFSLQMLYLLISISTEGCDLKKNVSHQNISWWLSPINNNNNNKIAIILACLLYPRCSVKHLTVT